MEAIDRAGPGPVNRNDSVAAVGVGSAPIINENLSHVWYFPGLSASYLTTALLLGHSTSQTFCHTHANKSWGTGENCKMHECSWF